MALEDQVITLAGLAEITMPGGVVRLCDGAFVDWPSRGMFTSEDDELGTIDSVSPVSEAVGDEAPQGSLTLLPPEGAAAADLVQPAAQGGAMYFWLAEVLQSTGEIVGTPELLFSGRLDTLKLTIGKRRTIDATFMSEAERLFWTREGNVFSPQWHKSIWPGETGLDAATGTQTTVPWGTNAPRGQSLTSGTGAVSSAFSSSFSQLFG